MNSARYFALTVIGLMAVAAIAILIFQLATPRRPKPMMTETCGLVFFLSFVGVFGFLTGLGLVFYNPGRNMKLGLALVGVGALCLCGSILLNVATAKAKRAAWPVVSARCLEQELQKFQSYEGADTWLWRVVCEINFAGKNYRVTPRVRWSDAAQADAAFFSEEKARRYLAQTISSLGECRLRINPDNPLDAELIG